MVAGSVDLTICWQSDKSSLVNKLQQPAWSDLASNCKLEEGSRLPCIGSLTAHPGVHTSTQTQLCMHMCNTHTSMMVPEQNLKYLMQTVCLLLRQKQCTDEWLIMATPALHTGYRIIKAWGYVLIILLNSDEILKSFSLRLKSRLDETKHSTACAAGLTCVFTSVQDISIWCSTSGDWD